MSRVSFGGAVAMLTGAGGGSGGGGFRRSDTAGALAGSSAPRCRHLPKGVPARRLSGSVSFRNHPSSCDLPFGPVSPLVPSLRMKQRRNISVRLDDLRLII